MKKANLWEQKKNFLTISQKDCLKYHSLLIKNAHRKFKTAELSAADGDYGSAISLLIISNEEIVKALLLFLDGNGFRFRSIKGINSVFKNHQLRYLIGLFISFMGIGAEIAKTIHETAEGNPSLIKIDDNEVHDFKGLFMVLNFFLRRKVVEFVKYID